MRAILKSSRYQIGGCQDKGSLPITGLLNFIKRAQKLTSPDNYFDLSFTNFVVTDLDDQKIVGQHLYRTLKPGGQAIVCTFAFCPHGGARRAAHLATRQPNAKLGLAYDPE
jgi:ubiquinone/menaquinone biosynthesis C-methylase UbiE